MRAGELRSFSLFNGLTDDQLAELVDGGTEVRVEPGVELFRGGEHADFWWVLVDGSVDLVRRIGREETLVGKMGVPGRWAGGFCAWDEHTVIRDYGADVPRIGAYPAELNQVWTNLIDNAVDAMGGAGTLRLATRAEGDGVVVEVGDTGPGIPPEVAARAFEAFYTTKDVGQGTGVGLDIAQRIVVERHGGTITIDSRPGETVLRVRLPARPRTARGRAAG
jgi:signal transduction histidine kinase